VSYLKAVRKSFGIAALARTGMLCLAVAVLLTLLGVTGAFGDTLITACFMGYSFHVTTALIVPLCVERLPWLVTMTLTLTAGLSIGVALSAWHATGDPLFFFRTTNSTLWLGFVFGVIGTTFFSSVAELNKMRERLALSEVKALEQQKQMAETQLKLLQAQIEPHFLFNTLSNVVSQIATDPAAARRTLENLTTLLRASLKRTRADATTLGEELDILRSYLEIQRMRMGDRLRFRITGDESCRQERLPPMLLQPLVENAVVHGLEPLEAGGELTIGVSTTPDDLVIAITDTSDVVNGGEHEHVGQRFGTGTGLANVRARLQALYGASASVTLLANPTNGATATLRLPRAMAAHAK
jgi:sensor histidine kinase YesM